MATKLRQSAERMIKAYDDVDGKFNIKLDKVLHLMRSNSKQDEDPAYIQEALDLLEDIDLLNHSRNRQANAIGIELEEVSGLCDTLNKNEDVHEAVKRADDCGAWGTVRNILEAAASKAADIYGAHNVEAKTLNAFTQYRA